MNFAITQQTNTIYPKTWWLRGKYLKFKLFFLLQFNNPTWLPRALQQKKLCKLVPEQQNDLLLLTGVAATRR